MLDLILCPRLHAFAHWRHSVALSNWWLHKDKPSNETAAFWGQIADITWIGYSLEYRAYLIDLLFQSMQ